ncbi:hypothetical protein IP70_19850 [alpha proteobacterium AAP38]|nr:hypothetical protein IP70_19850 [alpha proteobacterium AAP38]
MVIPALSKVVGPSAQKCEGGYALRRSQGRMSGNDRVPCAYAAQHIFPDARDMAGAIVAFTFRWVICEETFVIVI